MSPWDIAGFVTGLINIVLLVRNSVWNFPWAILNAGVFLVSFWLAGLYGDSSLQVLYIVLNAYGWYAWLHGGRGRSELPVSNVSRKWLLVTLVSAGLATCLFATVLSAWLGSTVPWFDGFTTATSIAAQVLLTRRMIENWYLWIAVDIVYVPLYLYKHLPLTSLLYVIFLGMSIAGAIAWRRDMQTATVV